MSRRGKTDHNRSGPACSTGSSSHGIAGQGQNRGSQPHELTPTTKAEEQPAQTPDCREMTEKSSKYTQKDNGQQRPVQAAPTPPVPKAHSCHPCRRASGTAETGCGEARRQPLARSQDLGFKEQLLGI